jgi:SOS-response transcriptional repressor LexA
MWADLCDNFQPDDHTVWHQCHIDLGPCGFVVTVRGPSMTAPAGAAYSFPEGMKLFVSPDAEALPGKFVIVARDNKATFKKLVQVDGELFLEALNPDWPERYQRLQKDDRFIGVVRHAGFDL